MTIGIDARFFGPKGKGLGRYTQKLIEGLEKIDSENQYIVFLRKENWDLYQPALPNFKKVLADYRWYSLAEQIFMPFLIYRAKIDLMHFPHFNVPIFYSGKFVVTIHDLILQHFPTRRASTLSPLIYWFKNLVYQIVIKSALKRAKKIITVSNYVKQDIIETFDVASDKIAVTYEGAPDRNSKVPGLAKRSGAHKIQNSNLILDKFKINNSYLLYVGNAYPHKNLENLIRAFEILIGDFKKDMQLVLVGEDDYFYRRLKKEAETTILSSIVVFQRIVFTGFVSDKELETLYENAALYVFPSLCEGFGLPPLEAMAQGVPVVSSGATCLPEILGEAAEYFDAKNPQDMAEKISKILSDKSLAEKLIIAGYGQIKKYSWEEMAKETLQIYKDLKN